MKVLIIYGVLALMHLIVCVLARRHVRNMESSTTNERRTEERA